MCSCDFERVKCDFNAVAKLKWISIVKFSNLKSSSVEFTILVLYYNSALFNFMSVCACFRFFHTQNSIWPFEG